LLEDRLALGGSKEGRQCAELRIGAPTLALVAALVCFRIRSPPDASSKRLTSMMRTRSLAASTGGGPRASDEQRGLTSSAINLPDADVVVPARGRRCGLDEVEL
jgi:hypothetical protein